MALINCTECGHEVSSKASACPNCAAPVEATAQVSKKKYETHRKCKSCGARLKKVSGVRSMVAKQAPSLRGFFYPVCRKCNKDNRYL